MAKKLGRGRRKGSRNKGYFYRKGRGWFAKEGSQFTPLTYEQGNRLRDESAPEAEIRAAHARWLLMKRDSTAAGTKQVPVGSATVLEICTAYLAKAKEERGKNRTFQDRAETLFDFCFGLPARFLGLDGKPKGKPTRDDKLHGGFGGLAASELKPLDIDRWLQAHPNWKGGKRTHIKAVVRAINYGVEAGLIPYNPIKGYRTPKVIGRVTYITPEQEAALCNAASPALAQAIKVLIRTGMRPGVEFCAATARHVKDHGDRIEIVFQPHESKTKRLRVIYVTAPEMIAVIRKQAQLNPSGPIFTGPRGAPWKQSNLSKRFRDARNKLIEEGVEFDKDCVLYSTRHTYAKRTLEGYWSGRPTNIETLARLMGNSPQICREHYLNWDVTNAEFLWASA